MTNMNNIEDLKIIGMKTDAARLHADVNQKYDNKSYFVHLADVLQLATMYAQEEPVFRENLYIISFGALFHDTIEDARQTYNDILRYACKYFGGEDARAATEIVYALTNEKGRTRKERANEKYYEGIRTTPFAPFIKACDRLANYNYSKMMKSTMEKTYRNEMSDFISHIKSDNPDKRFSIPDDLIAALQS